VPVLNSENDNKSKKLDLNFIPWREQEDMERKRKEAQELGLEEPKPKEPTHCESTPEVVQPDSSQKTSTKKEKRTWEEVIKIRPESVDSFISFSHWLVWAFVKPLPLVGAFLSDVSDTYREEFFDKRPQCPKNLFGLIQQVVWFIRATLIAVFGWICTIVLYSIFFVRAAWQILLILIGVSIIVRIVYVVWIVVRALFIASFMM